MDAWLCRNRLHFAEYEAKQWRLHIKELETRERRRKLAYLHFFTSYEHPVRPCDDHRWTYHRWTYRPSMSHRSYHHLSSSS